MGGRAAVTSRSAGLPSSCLPDIARNGGLTALALLLAGGVLYTVGAACFAMQWPNPWPKTFAHHEFFHAFTLIAALCQYAAIYFVLF